MLSIIVPRFRDIRITCRTSDKSACVAYSLTLASSSTPCHESFVARTHDDEDETEVVLKSTSGTVVMLDCWMAALDSRAMATRYRVLMPSLVLQASSLF